ncbi:MAG: ABC transporter ATP-binding protein [Clostridiales bacterium]|nr:ABC transporter ATP-binding protein [Candidatus Cacconaster stercorequi]
MTAPAVELQHITKCFAKVVANKDVSLTVNNGEVVALLGENGAGKSTIMKILYGLYGLDEGKIFVRGEEVQIKTPADAMAKGIAMIQQHFSLVPTHTAAENIILGNVRGYIPIKNYEQKLKKIALEHGFDVPMDRPVGELAVGQQQKIEILKALYINTSILIMDEPTAVLTPQESESLMQFIKEFAAKGNSVVFITHKMKEVMEVADRIVVMRNGVVVAEKRRQETTEQELARLMIGQELTPAVRDASRDTTAGEGVLQFENVSLQPKKGTALLNDIDFTIHAGEIFGIAGVSGNGQDELCDIISGVRQPTSGRVLLAGKDISKESIRARNAFGIGYVPVDRYRDAMIKDMNLAENILLKGVFDKKWFNRGFIRHKKLNAYTNELIERHRVKANDYNDLAGSLSGGNQQKIVLGREVDIGSRLLVFNQPTRGLDMGAVDRIHHVIMEEKDNGKAVLLVSTELSEIFEMCDRIAVMHNGRFMGIYRNGELTTEQIGLLMAGIHFDGEEAAAL